MKSYNIEKIELINLVSVFHAKPAMAEFVVSKFLQGRQPLEKITEGDIEEVLEDFRAWVHEQHKTVFKEGAKLKMITIYVKESPEELLGDKKLEVLIKEAENDNS